MKRALSLCRKVSLQHLLPPGLMALLLPVLWDRVAALDPEAVRATLASATWMDWTFALLASGLSFMAIGRYDTVLHRALGTGVAPGRAAWAGIKAIALAQTLGLSAVTGALVRWRALPELNLIQTTRLAVFVGASFFAAWALVTLCVVALFGAAAQLPAWVAGLALGTLGLAVLVARFHDRIPAGILPPIGIRGAAQLVVWTFLDTAFAAYALWIFLPDSAEIAAPAFFVAYLLALGAGLVSNTPGGVGAFELTLFALLPQIAEPELVAAVLGYRVVYYLVPAGVALVGLALPQRSPGRSGLAVASPLHLPRLIDRFARPDWTLVQQHGEILAPEGGTGGWYCSAARNTLVGFGEAEGQAGAADLAAEARLRGMRPLIYKTGRRSALHLRAKGWVVLRSAAVGVIDPRRWSLDTPVHRQLRRKLRHAARGGVTVCKDGRPLPIADMARVAAEWARTSGGERGFSVGQFAPQALAGQRIYLASSHDGLLAFVTFRNCGGRWLLDLMRHRNAIPDGTMHALIVAALDDARSEGATEVSLDAVPAFGGWLARLNRSGLGLAQFKQSFAPDWHPHYCAAPTRLALILGLLDTALAVRRTRPLPQDHPHADEAGQPLTLYPAE